MHKRYYTIQKYYGGFKPMETRTIELGDNPIEAITRIKKEWKCDFDYGDAFCETSHRIYIKYTFDVPKGRRHARSRAEYMLAKSKMEKPWLDFKDILFDEDEIMI